MPGTTVENINIEVKTNAGDAARQFSSLADAIKGVEGASKAAGNAGETVANSVNNARKNAQPLSAQLQSAIKNATKVEIYARKATQAEESMYKAFDSGSESAAWRQREKYLNADAAMQRELGKNAGDASHPLTAEQQALIATADAAGVLTQKLESLKEAQSEAFQKGDWDKAWQTQGQILSTQAQLDRVANAANDAGQSSQKAAPKVFSLKSAVQGLVSAIKKLFSHGNHAAKSISRMGSAAKSSTGFMGKLFNSIKRIALYRMLRTFIKDISQSFQEGLKNAYAFSKAIGGDLARALDSVASAGGQMKNQMGAALGELLQTIQPIIEAIISMVTRLMQVLSALFAALGGRLTYSVAEKTAEAWDDAAGLAKEYKNTVLGFDELNKLNAESGGGGGGGAEGAFKDVELPEWALKLKDLFDQLKDLFKIGDFAGAGEALAKWLNDIWPSDEWFYEKGVWLGEQINKVLEFAYAFLTNADWERFGGGIASFFNGLFDTVDWELLGRTIVRGITAALDFVIGFIKKLDTGSIGAAIRKFFVGVFDEATQWLTEHNWTEFGSIITGKISKFFEELKPEDIAVTISGFLTRLFLSIANFFKGGDWEQAGTDAGDAISKFVENINWTRIAETASGALMAAVEAIGGFAHGLTGGINSVVSGIKTFLQNVKWAEIAREFTTQLNRLLNDINWDEVGSTIFELFHGVLTFLITAVETFDWAGFGRSIREFIAGIDWLQLIEDFLMLGAQIVLGLLEGIGEAMRPIFEWVKEHIVDPIVNAFKNLFGIHSPSTVFEGFGGQLIEGLFNGIINTLSDIWNWIKTNIVDPIVDAVKKLFGIDGDESTTFAEFGKNIIAGLLSGLKNAWESITKWFSEAWKGITDWWEGLSLKAPKMETPDYSSVMLTTAGYANGGTIENNGTLFVAGEAGPEIVANMGSRTGVMNVEQMEAAVANGNIGVINAVYQMANMIVKAVNEIDPDITLDGESLADKMYNYNQNAAKRRGVAMVT